jgi:cyclase
VIPCLLVKDGGLVKTTRFESPKYVGDPINAVRIFNEKAVDEIMVLDVDATIRGRQPDYALIKRIAAECRMPLAYGGGVTSVSQLQRIVELGVEKVALSAAAIEQPSLVSEAAARVGRQTVVVVLDIRKTGLRRHYEVVTHNGTRQTGLDPADVARRMEAMGAGEIVLNSVDRDGTMEGYDLDLVAKVRSGLSLPVTVLGGAGSLTDIQQLVRRYPIIGAAAGSLFVFKGKYRAVLISYPTLDERQRFGF